MILGVVTVVLLQKRGLVSSATSCTPAATIPAQGSTALATLTSREQAETELAEMLQQIAVGDLTSLPRILPRLRYILSDWEGATTHLGAKLS